MKKVFVVCLSLIFLLIIVPSAFAAGYNYQYKQTIPSGTQPGDANKPHGNYATTTNKCKTCHAVHLAEGNYMLLRASTPLSIGGECGYCHDPGGVAASLVPPVTTNSQGHTMGETGKAPDDTDSSTTPAFDPGTNGLRCSSCHSVHGTNTVIPTGATYSNPILRADPDKNDSIWTGTGSLTLWCADCHSANWGLYTDPKTVDSANPGYPGDPGDKIFFGHDCSAESYHGSDKGDYPCTRCHKPGGSASHKVNVSFADSNNKGPTCQQCHQSTGFPHYQGPLSGPVTSKDMLKDSFAQTGSPQYYPLDAVCMDCHHTASLP